QRASSWVDDHGECLYRYALVRVRKPEVAEDLVQETFLAAVRGYEKFVSVGFWNHDLGPYEWKPEPDEVMHRAEFWQVMRDCLSNCQKKSAPFLPCAKWMVCPVRRFARSSRSATAIFG